ESGPSVRKPGKVCPFRRMVPGANVRVVFVVEAVVDVPAVVGGRPAGPVVLVVVLMVVELPVPGNLGMVAPLGATLISAGSGVFGLIGRLTRPGAGTKTSGRGCPWMSMKEVGAVSGSTSRYGISTKKLNASMAPSMYRLRSSWSMSAAMQAGPLPTPCRK